MTSRADRILEARQIVVRLIAASGDLDAVTREEAELLLDLIAVREEHEV